jgi:uncharacterized protein DUF4260
MLGPVVLQRVEGLALLVLAVVLFAWTDASWLWFGLLLLAPDLSMVGYLKDARLGAAIYNVGHWLLWPALLLAIGIPSGRTTLIGIGSIWLAHIGMDRALGYGFKLGDSFTHTHLGWIGRKTQGATRSP